MKHHNALDVGDITAAQRDGAAPQVVVSGAAPGESGVAVTSAFYCGAAHFYANLRCHIICFSSAGTVHYRRAGEAITHEAPKGSVSFHPAGLDCLAELAGDVLSTYVIVDPARLALAAADSSASTAQLTDIMHAFDPELVACAHTLLSECRDNYPRGTIFWNETAARFLAALVARHMTGARLDSGGVLEAEMLARLRDYVMAHLDQPIDVRTMAKLCGRSQYHFTRVFTRTVGVSPYRYVVHLRLQRAVELIRARRAGGSSMAEIAQRVGFADQSHLTHWVRRVYGVTPTALEHYGRARVEHGSTRAVDLPALG